MPEVATGTVSGAPEGSPQWISWREAVTPLSRGSRRRWVVFYVLLLLATAAVAGWREGLGLHEKAGDSLFLAVIVMFLVFGMLRRGTRQLTAFDRPRLDERDRQELHSAFRYAYPLFMAVMVASFAVVALTLPDVKRRYSDDGFTQIDAGQFLGPDALIGIPLWGFLWAVFLPTAVLAWREPDAVSADEDAVDGPSELIRDLVLAAALVAAIVLDAVEGTNGYVGPLLLVGALATVAAWWRHAFGQHPVSSWLHTAGIFLAVMGVASLIVAAFAGGTTDTIGWIVTAAMVLVGVPLAALGRKA